MALWMSKSYTRNPRLQTLPDLPQVFPPQRWAFQLPRCILHPIKGSVENGRPPDPADWAVTDVVNYFRTAGFEEQANAFQEQEIDGKSLLLMTRNDVLTGLALKLGPALKIYEYHVKPLQTQHLKNNSL
ncbi:sterile alpha motif domain-containing protein 13 isoform X1 [Caretta caretta]|uniref:sterile alpha motif domain-containing protein 13 isoform X1 n=1 Tax=Caretta caretta TaxID=8467 RepID=UPI003F4B1027